MTVFVVGSKAILDEIAALPAIAGDAAPLLLGEPVCEACEKPRWAVSHEFTEAQQDWMLAYTSGESPPGRVYDTLPDDWVYPTPELDPEPTPAPNVEPIAEGGDI